MDPQIRLQSQRDWWLLLFWRRTTCLFGVESASVNWVNSRFRVWKCVYKWKRMDFFHWINCKREKVVTTWSNTIETLLQNPDIDDSQLRGWWVGYSSLIQKFSLTWPAPGVPSSDIRPNHRRFPIVRLATSSPQPRLIFSKSPGQDLRQPGIKVRVR